MQALIVGAGEGLSASVARAFAADGMKLSLASRHPERLMELAREISAETYRCDVASRADVESLFETLDGSGATPDVVLFNPSARARGPLVDLDPDDVARTLTVTAHGGFLVAQAAARRMLGKGGGTILFTGASASVKGYPQSAPFAMGKFALRGLAQSMARELQPKNIHVCHFVIDGAIANPGRTPETPDAMLEPDAIAQTYLHVVRQHRSAWTSEVELRPWVEKF